MAKLTLFGLPVPAMSPVRDHPAGREDRAISLDAEHRVDTAELLRIGYQLDAAVLHAATQQFPMQTQQNAAPQHSTSPQQGAAAQELQLLRQERDVLQRERDLLMQQVNMLHTIHQTTQQQLTQAQQMLHEMQHRYDRLLEAPRNSPSDKEPATRPTINHALQAPMREPLGERCVGALWVWWGSIRRD